MARPQKEALEYFPLDVDIDQDDKLIVPIAKHGMLGFGVIIKLMMEIYKNGYYYPWTEKELYVFPFKISVESEKVNEIVIDCINSGFFCKNQYNRNQILTSYGFQKRFLLATTRRKDATINNHYLVEKELLNTETELLNTETKESSAKSTQSKVKESKVNESKVREGNARDPDIIELDSIEIQKERISKQLIESETTNFTLYHLDILNSYIGVVEIEVIEAAIKKGQKKHVQYTITTLENWVKEGKVRKEHILPKPEPGVYEKGSTNRNGNSGKPKLSIIGDKGNDDSLSENEITEMLIKAHKLDNLPPPNEEQIKEFISKMNSQRGSPVETH